VLVRDAAYLGLAVGRLWLRHFDLDLLVWIWYVTHAFEVPLFIENDCGHGLNHAGSELVNWTTL